MFGHVSKIVLDALLAATCDDLTGADYVSSFTLALNSLSLARSYATSENRARITKSDQNLKAKCDLRQTGDVSFNLGKT